MSLIPGMGIVRGMGLTLRKFFEPKATIRYPEEQADVAPKFRGRLQLLYDEYGHAQVRDVLPVRAGLPIECIDMGGIDTKGRFHVHWGPPRDVRRAARGVRAAPLRPPGRRPGVRPLRPVDLAPWTTSSSGTTTTRSGLLAILEETQAEYGYLPVARSSHISRITGAWYAMLYGTATYYRHLRFEPPAVDGVPPRGEAPPRPRPPTAPRSTPRSARGRGRLMATFLKTPREWPRILTGRATLSAPTRPTSTPRSAAGAFDGLRKAVRDLGADRDHRDRRGVRPPRPRRRRLPDRREVARRRGAAAPASATSSPTATARTRARTDQALLAADPWAVIEGLRSRRSPSGRPRRSSRSAARTRRS